MSRYETFITRIEELVAERGIAQIERELGWPPKKFHKTRRRKPGFRLREVSDILDALGYRLSVTADRPPLLESPARRFLREGKDLLQQGGTPLPELRGEPAPDRLSPEHLRILDELRLHDPEKAANLLASMAAEAARKGRVRDAVSLTARRAAALRLRLDPHGAHACLVWALGQRPRDPDLWLRASYLVADYGDFSEALELAGKALAGYAGRGDQEGIGRCVLQRGRMYHRLGEVSRARQSFQASLDWLPRHLIRHRVAAHQNLGLALVEAEQLEQAAFHADRAAALESPPGIEGGRLLWLRARIAARRRRTEEAIELFRRTVEHLQPSPDNAAVATCELVSLLLETGETAEAVARAREVLRYTRPNGNRIVAAALMKLHRAADQGAEQLQEELVQGVAARIERAQRRTRRRAATRPSA